MFHELKIWPRFFAPVLDGSKTYEVRRNDRGFQSGDRVLLREWDPETGLYSGREIEKRIGFLLPIDSQLVVFSLLQSKETDRASKIHSAIFEKLKHAETVGMSEKEAEDLADELLGPLLEVL